VFSAGSTDALGAGIVVDDREHRGNDEQLMTVETTKPPMTAIPIGARKLGSPAQPIAICVMPAIIAIVVMTIGRARFEHESINESNRDRP
jgi:hypothetical protein